MNPSPPPPAQLLVDLGFGFILSGALAAVTQLGVADRLAEGPKHPEVLAKELGPMRARSSGCSACWRA